MRKTSLSILVTLLPIAALVLSACGAVTISSSTQMTAEFQTAVAQTVTAQAPTDTPTPKFTQTYIPSETPVPTITETPTLTIVPPTSVMDIYCDNSAFVADVTIPDLTVLAPGQVFEKTWTVKNIGTCTWKPGYTIVFKSGDLMQGNTREVGQAVAPQEEVNVTVRLTAPHNPGEYTGVWRLANGKGEGFGEYVSVKIVVAGSGTTIPTVEANPPTVTPTP